MSDDERPVVIVKFRHMAEQKKRCTQLCEWVGPEFAGAEPLFPDETEPELGSLFQVTLSSAAKVPVILESLSVEKDVEYAHEPATRSLSSDE